MACLKHSPQQMGGPVSQLPLGSASLLERSGFLSCEEIIQLVSWTELVALASSGVLGFQSKLWPSHQPLNLTY